MNTIINPADIPSAEGLVVDVVATQYAGTAENVRIPEGITALEQWTFWANGDNNHTMKRICIPETMTRIQGDLFGRCFELEEIFIPASVKEIVVSPFSGQNFWQDPHRPFKKIYVEPDSYAEAFAIRHGIAYGYIPQADAVWDEESNDVWKIALTVKASTGSEKTVVIPEGITCIDASAFENNGHIEAVVLPESLETIRDSAFSGCSCLNSVLGLEKTKITALPAGAFRD